MGAPLTARSSTSVTLAGNIAAAAGAALLGAAGLGALGAVATPGPVGLARLSSLELQLEIPNAASIPNTRTVKAMRVGVHNGFPL